MAAVTVTHSTITGAPADATALVDGPKWDAGHVVAGLENVPNVDTTNADNITGGSQTGTGALVRAGTPTFTGTVQITPPASSNVPSIIAIQSLHGAYTGSLSANTLYVGSDDAATTSGALIWNYGHNFGGANLHGNRLTFSLQSVFTAPSDGAAFQLPSGPHYVAFAPSILVNADDHGTDSTTGTARGAFTTMNPVAKGSAASKFLYTLNPQENNVSMPAGGSAAYIAALSLVYLADHAVAGTETDALLVLSANTGASVGAKTLIKIGPDNGQVPFDASSTLLHATTGPAANGIILEPTFSGLAFGSTGFNVNGAGVTQVTTAANGPGFLAKSSDNTQTGYAFLNPAGTTIGSILQHSLTGLVSFNTASVANYLTVAFATGLATFADGVLSKSASAGIGYAAGAGGPITQITSRTTGVTLNKVSGAITLFSQINTAISQATAQSFTVTNSTVAATDVIVVNQKSGTDKYEIFVTSVAAGSFQITNYAVAGTTNEAPVFNFAIVKAVAS